MKNTTIDKAMIELEMTIYVLGRINKEIKHIRFLPNVQARNTGL